VLLDLNHYYDCDNNNSYSHDDQDVAHGVRFLYQLFHRGHFVEGNLAVSGALIHESKAGFRHLSSRASQCLFVLEANFDVGTRWHSGNLISHVNRAESRWTQMAHH